jgi:hypothetical protein
MIPFLTALPLATKLAVTTIAFTAVFGFGMYLGNKIGVSSCHEAVIEAQRHSIETGVKQAEVSDKIVTKYVDRVKIVKKNVVKEVKVYVKDDANIMLSPNFRLFHDSSANNEIPSRTSNPDGKAVTVEDLANTIAGNYGICHENSATLISLQDWVREQSMIK